MADPPAPSWMRALLALCLVLVYSSLSACATADKYRLVEPGMPPARALHMATDTMPLDLALKSVIVTGGEGSWKLKALWDEYVVHLTNHSEQAISLLSVQLVDAGGVSRAPSDDPWQLEELSYTAWDQYGRSALRAAGWTIEGVALATAVAVAGSSGIKPGSPSALGKVVIAAGALGLIDLAVVAVMDSDNKQEVETNFQRRRLPVARRIAPQESVDGSLFFPVTLRPKSLVLKAVSDGQPIEVTLDVGAISPMRPGLNR